MGFIMAFGYMYVVSFALIYLCLQGCPSSPCISPGPCPAFVSPASHHSAVPHSLIPLGVCSPTSLKVPFLL